MANMSGLSGLALAGYLSDLEKKDKRAMGALGTLNKEKNAYDEYQKKKESTERWLASLTPEERAKVAPSTANVPSTFEDIGDISGFDFDRRSRELGLTSEFSTSPNVQNYLADIEASKAKKKEADVTSALDYATTDLQLQKQLGDIEALEEKAGIPKGDYTRRSPRETAISAGLPKFGDDKRVTEFIDEFVRRPEDVGTEEDKQKALNIVNMIEQSGGYMDTPEQLELDRGFANTKPLLFMQRFSEKMRDTSEGLRGKKEAIPIEVEKTEALISPKASTAAAETEARETTKREIQKKAPIISEAQSGALTDSFDAVRYLSNLKKAIQDGNAGYFDVDRKTGQFTNPEVANAFEQMVEIVARKRSGAAINDGEWKSFGKQVLNKNFLLTEKGRAEALKNIDRYLDKFYGAGTLVAGDEDWYNTHKLRLSTARQKAEASNHELKTIEGDANFDLNKMHVITSEEEFDKLPSGAKFRGPDGKARRKP